MFSTHKRILTRTLLPASLLLTGALLSGCSDDAEKTASESKPSQSASGPFQQALAYSECMRAEGLPDFPDPQQANGGVRMGGGDVDTNSPEFQKAQKACQDKAPQGQGQSAGGTGGGEALDPKKVAAWAECIRKHGVPKFPDPEIQGGQMALDFGSAGIRMEDAKFQKARETCQPKWPGGGMMIQGSGQ